MQEQQRTYIAILRGLNFEECAIARERNKQIGGHKA
jgi:hypothetical protein